MIALVILASAMSAALVAAYSEVSPDERARVRAKPGFWRDAEHCG